MADQNRGGFMEITDKDWIEYLKLDPSMEGNPNINRVIRDKVREQTKNGYMEQGMPEGMAEKLSRKHVK